MDSYLPFGTLVRVNVFVLGEMVPMHIGTVVCDHGDGSVDVDRMGLHGGRPWVTRETKSHLTIVAKINGDSDA